jgi:DNA-binding HxlR family transcriptional regulator
MDVIIYDKTKVNENIPTMQERVKLEAPNLNNTFELYQSGLSRINKRQYEDERDVLEVHDIVSRVLRRRWSLLIITKIINREVIRFNELKRALEGISSNVLSDSLLELEHEGLISKKIYPEIPIKVEYRLTPQARELENIIKELWEWASRWKLPQLQHTELQ